MVQNKDQIVNRPALFPRDSEAVERLRGMEAMQDRSTYMSELRGQVASYRAAALHLTANEEPGLAEIFGGKADALEGALDDIEDHWLPLLWEVALEERYREVL